MPSWRTDHPSGSLLPSPLPSSLRSWGGGASRSPAAPSKVVVASWPLALCGHCTYPSSGRPGLPWGWPACPSVCPHLAPSWTLRRAAAQPRLLPPLSSSQKHEAGPQAQRPPRFPAWVCLVALVTLCSARRAPALCHHPQALHLLLQEQHVRLAAGRLLPEWLQPVSARPACCPAHLADWAWSQRSSPTQPSALPRSLRARPPLCPEHRPCPDLLARVLPGWGPVPCFTSAVG